ALLALGLAVWVGPVLGQGDTGARTAFQAADAALAHHSDGFFFDDNPHAPCNHSDCFFLDDDPQAPALLEREWSVVRQWAVAYLNEHPAATESEVASAISRLSPDLGIEALWLDQRTILVSASRGEMGTVFVAGAHGN